jgi:hypothetical protein
VIGGPGKDKILAKFEEIFASLSATRRSQSDVIHTLQVVQLAKKYVTVGTKGSPHEAEILAR